MNNNTNQRGQTLIIIMTALFLGGSSLALGVATTGKTLKEIEKSIKSDVRDETNKQISLALVKQWKKEGKAVRKQFNVQRKDLLKMLNNHNSRETDLVAAVNEILELDRQSSERVLDLHYELRKSMTKQEWESVFSISDK